MLTTLTFCRKNSHPRICFCRAIHVSKLTLTSTTTPPGTTVIQASSAHLTHTFEMVNHPMLNILIVPESKIQIAVKTCWRNSVQLLSVFLYHDSWKNAWKTFCIRIGHVIRCSGFKCCLSKWRHRIRCQSYTTIILLANNIVAIIHLFEYNIKFLRFC